MESGKTATALIGSELPIKANYTLSGWNTKADGTGTKFEFGTTTVTADITIYAQWSQNIPAVPSGLSATAISTTQINLSWTATATATKYNLFDGTTQIGGDITTTSYQHTGLTANSTHSYTLKACNSGGCSAASSAVSATTINNDATLNSITLTINGAVYTANSFTNNADTIYLPYKSTIPATATIKNLTMSTGATANPSLNAAVNISAAGLVTLTITAQDGTTNNVYSIQILVDNFFKLLNNNYPHAYHGVLVFNNKLFTINTNKGTVSSSTDGITWTTLTTTPTFFTASAAGSRFVVFNNKMWMIGGGLSVNPFTANNDVWSSTDGITWVKTSATTTRFSARSHHNLLVFTKSGTEKMYVLGGTNSTNYFNDVWSSADGETWTEETAASTSKFTARQLPGAVIFNNKMWILGGDATNKIDDVWSSADGVSWTQEVSNANFLSKNANDYYARGNFLSLVYENKMWVIGGNNIDVNLNPNNFSDIWYSADGTTWTKETENGGYGVRLSAAAVVFPINGVNKMLLLGGNGTPTIYYGP